MQNQDILDRLAETLAALFIIVFLCVGGELHRAL